MPKDNNHYQPISSGGLNILWSAAQSQTDASGKHPTFAEISHETGREAPNTLSERGSEKRITSPTEEVKKKPLNRLKVLTSCQKMRIIFVRRPRMTLTAQEASRLMGAPYGKTTNQLKKMAVRHWREWRPKMAAEMEESNRLEHEALIAAEKVQAGIKELKEAGYQHHEAEEVMLKRYILLEPEQEVIDEMERE